MTTFSLAYLLKNIYSIIVFICRNRNIPQLERVTVAQYCECTVRSSAGDTRCWNFWLRQAKLKVMAMPGNYLLG